MSSDFDHSIDLLFAHWRVDVSEVRRAVPAAFDPDLFHDEAWLGVVPFHMTNVGLRATPVVPWISAFPELNVRTYVRVADRPGMYCFSPDAARWLAVAAARTLSNLPYYGPVGNCCAQRQQECWKRPSCCPIVRLAEERHSPPSDDTASRNPNIQHRRSLRGGLAHERP
jgi:hypothetical protein